MNVGGVAYQAILAHISQFKGITRSLAGARPSQLLILLLSLFWAATHPTKVGAQEVRPPIEPWTLHSTIAYCDWYTRYTFQSSWPGDSPIELLQEYIELLDAKCSTSSGAFFTVTHTLNACDPTINLFSNGAGNARAWATAAGCTYRRHVNPNASCPSAQNPGLCQPSIEDRSAPQPVKTCDTSQLANGVQFTLMGPPSYGECKCPAGTTWVDTHNRCVPIINQVRKPPDMCAGNPIQPATGNKRQIDIDYIDNGVAALTFSRTYNSATTFDQKWTSNLHRSTTWGSNGGPWATHLFHRSEGSYPFAYNGASYVADPDVNLQYIGGGNLVVENGRIVEHYTAMQMDQVRTRSGTVLQTLAYSTASTPQTIAPSVGLLIGISNAFGQSLSLTYDAQGRMATMTDPGGGVYHYAYDSMGNLTSVTYPDGAARTYLYNEPAHNGGIGSDRLLTGIIDESNQRYATFGYDANGLAVLTEHAGGADRYTLSYSGAPVVSSELVLDASNRPKYVRKYYQPPAQTSITDGLGQTRSYNFLQLNGSSKTSGSSAIGTGSCSAIPQSRSFDANGNTTSSVDFNGNKTCHSHDPTRNLETVRIEGFAPTASCPANLATYTPPATTRQRKITTQWHTTFRLPTQMDETGKRTTFTYDGNGNVLTRTVRDTTTNLSRTWTYTYNSYGQVLTENGPRTDASDLTTYTYYNCNTGYQCGQVETITNALGHVTTYNAYNAHGQPLTVTAANGVVTTLTYDLRQRLTSRTVGTAVTSFDYWPTGLLKKATLPDGSYLEYTYDAAHRLTDINDSEGNRIHYTLDAMGNRTAEEVFDSSNALARTRTSVFNTLNQLNKEIGAAGGASVTTTFGYDNNGNQTDIDAPLSRSTDQTYDELNRLSSVTDPAGGTTHYGYNALDQLISVTDPRGKVTSYEYNALGDLLEQVSPDTDTSVFTYDSAGNVKTKTDARGKTGTYTYDALSRVTSVTYPDQTITYVYDTGTNQKGRLTQVADNSGSTSWTYDAQGRVLSREQTMESVTKTLGYSYDAAGRLDTLTLPSGNTITYGYTNGKVTSLTLNGSTTILSNVLYQPFGPSIGWTWGNSTLTVREYDLDGKMTDLDSAGLKTYGYDDAFRITSITDATEPSLSQSYGYDLLDRLTSATGTNLNQSWTYDANGNRLTQDGSDPSAYTISSTSNRIDAITGSLSRTYGYDAAGNTTSDGIATYSYDDAGRMVSASKSGVSATYSLNALGQRVRKTVAGVSTYFVYDEFGYLIGEYDASGDLQQETIWLGNIPVGVLKPNGSGVDLLYIHSDHLDTPRRISRPSDNVVVWRWDSDPFGVRTPREDPDGDSVLLTQNLRFSGQFYDSEAELHYNYFRTYDPSVGRYVQSDPIGLKGGLNTYAYAFAVPTMFVDPKGLQAVYSGCAGYRGTVLCDGKGGFEIRNCNNTCTRSCTQAHEEQHVKDFEATHPNRCKNRARGTSPTAEEDYSGSHFFYVSECKAHMIGKKCAETLKATGCCPDAESYIEEQEIMLRYYRCNFVSR